MTAVTFPRRRLLGGLGAATAVVLIVGGIAAYTLSTRVTPVTVSEAIARYRTATGAQPQQALLPLAAGTGAGPAATVATGGAVTTGTPELVGAARPPAPVVPVAGSGAAAVRSAAIQTGSGPTPNAAPGVYTYATNGSEHVTALGGSTHNYPSRTTMTVTSTDCGVDVRWDALQQRYDEWQLCAAGQGLALRSLTTYHDFFNQVDKRIYTCTADTRFRPDSTAPGATFGGSCSASGAAALLRGRVIGIERVTVGNATVTAVHVHLDEELTGATRGTRSSDTWYETSDNLLVRRISATDADTETSFGATHYTERVQLQLTDLQPVS